MDVDGGAGSTAGTASPEPSGLGETLSGGAKAGGTLRKSAMLYGFNVGMSQCHKPPIFDGWNPTYENCDEWGMGYDYL